MGILTTFTGNIDQLFLFHYVGAVEVAIYNFATGVLDQSKGPLKALDTMIQSRFASQESRSIRDSMRNKMFWLFIASLISVVVYIVAAPYIYKILFPAYTDAVLYSQVYALSLLATFLSPAGSFLSAKKRVKAQYISNIVVSIGQILSIVIGIIYWGLWGLIGARIFIRVGGAAFNYLLYRFLPEPKD
jgi:O-antigen/teichoic acid export membrane protein